VTGLSTTASSPAACPDTEDPPYALFHKGPTSGGFVKVESENHVTPAHASGGLVKDRVAVKVTIAVEDVDEALKIIEGAGGKAWLPKHEIPGGMGFTASFVDTEGNVCGVWAMNDKGGK